MKGVQDRISMYFLDYPTIAEQVRYAKYAEAKGFEAIWVAETRMARDAPSVLGALAASTKRVRLGSAVINCWSRIPPLIALTWATLDELAPGRLILGIGAWWDPLAFRAGVVRKNILARMKDYVHIIRKLFSMEKVTYRGETYQVSDLYLDLGKDVPRKPKQIPIMIGASGLRMHKLAGEVADGDILNFFVSPEYNKKAVEAIKEGARKSGRKINQIERPQLIACSMDEDSDKALGRMRYLVAMYLGQQPHVMKASGVKQSLIDEIHQALGGWPPKKGGIETAAPLVDDKIVRLLTASGAADECRRKIKEYVEAGATLPMISPVGANVKKMIDVFAEGYT